MGKLKITDDELDVKELEDAEYDEDREFTPYSGDIPPAGTLVPGFIKKMWWSYSSNDNPMLTVLFIADETAGEYEGLPIWDYITFTSGAKFRWKPFLDRLGLTIRDVKTKLYVDDEDDNQGAPVEKIGSWVPGEESDDAYLTVLTTRERYEGQWRAKVGRWLDYEPGDGADEEEEEEEPPAKPARKTSTRKAAAKEPEPEPDDEDEDEDEEPEEEAKPAPRSRGRTAAKPAEAKPAATGARRAARTATPATPAKASAGRGRRSSGTTDDPPF